MYLVPDNITVFTHSIQLCFFTESTRHSHFISKLRQSEVIKAEGTRSLCNIRKVKNQCVEVVHWAIIPTMLTIILVLCSEVLESALTSAAITLSLLTQY